MKSLRDGDPVSYKQSIGGAYYVSVTSGFYCIDIRKFYLPYGLRRDDGRQTDASGIGIVTARVE